jgi:hypothetical protein
VRALAPAALGIGPAPPNLSVVLGERSGRTRSKHQLHVQGELSTITAADGTLVRAVVRALGSLAADAPEGRLTVNAVPVIGPRGAATIVDRRLVTELRRLEPVVRRAGAHVVDVTRVVVRSDTSSAILPDGAGALGVSVAAIDRRWPRARGDDDLRAGEVRVGRIVYAGRPDPESPAAAIADMASMVRDGGRLRTDDIAALAALARAVECHPAAGRDRARLRRALGVG